MLAWNRSNSPPYPWRKTSDPYHILVAEMLLRRTRADRVRGVYESFLSRFPSLEALSAADAEQIHRLIGSLGLDSRSAWIPSISKEMDRCFADHVISNTHHLESALGKSRYILNAIRCFAFGENAAIFDVNVKRILQRVFSIEFGKEAHKNDRSWEIASMIVPHRQSKEYNWAMIDLGRQICTAKNPKCGICPLKTDCDFAKRFVS